MQLYSTFLLHFRHFHIRSSITLLLHCLLFAISSLFRRYTFFIFYPPSPWQRYICFASSDIPRLSPVSVKYEILFFPLDAVRAVYRLRRGNYYIQWKFKNKLFPQNGSLMFRETVNNNTSTILILKRAVRISRKNV